VTHWQGPLLSEVTGRSESTALNFARFVKGMVPVRPIEGGLDSATQEQSHSATLFGKARSTQARGRVPANEGSDLTRRLQIASGRVLAFGGHGGSNLNLNLFLPEHTATHRQIQLESRGGTVNIGCL
jgi:hypothetical protein